MKSDQRTDFQIGERRAAVLWSGEQIEQEEGLEEEELLEEEHVEEGVRRRVSGGEGAGEKGRLAKEEARQEEVELEEEA